VRILELTATPDRTYQPAMCLQCFRIGICYFEDMIKMPLTLVQRPNWLDALRDAIACLNKLNEKA